MSSTPGEPGVAHRLFRDVAGCGTVSATGGSRGAVVTVRGHSSESEQIMTDPVKGPASYFPSIEKTYGRPVPEWQELVRSSPLTKHGELVTWLKTEHGMGHGHATAIVASVLTPTTDRGRGGAAPR